MDYTDIINRLRTQLDTKLATTMFINGATGTGKSFLQQRLATDIPTRITRSKIFGPYKVHSADALGRQLFRDLRDLGYITSVPSADLASDLAGIWRWLKDNVQAPNRSIFIILIDLDGVGWNDYDELRVWFSSIRSLEHFWDSGPINLAVLITGFWDHPGLKIFYEQSQFSFPYTSGKNYILWEEIPISCSMELISAHLNGPASSPTQIMFGRLLYEICSGNPSVMKEILQSIEPGNISVDALLKSAQQAASNGSVGQALLMNWKQLTPDSIKLIDELLLLRQIPVISLPVGLERLKIVGILKEKIILNQRFATLRSWYIEMLLRLHAAEIGIESPTSSGPLLDELMPTITVLQQDAYTLIHEIENLLRNFLITHLAIKRLDSHHLLNGRYVRKIRKEDLDAQQRAERMRSTSFDNGLPVHLNPDIAYLYLSDLGGILKEIAEQIDSADWRRVAEAVDRVSYIRNAVMHNQIIEISDLQKIYDLQAEIFTALNETSASFSGL